MVALRHPAKTAISQSVTYRSMTWSFDTTPIHAWSYLSLQEKDVSSSSSPGFTCQTCDTYHADLPHPLSLPKDVLTLKQLKLRLLQKTLEGHGLGKMTLSCDDCGVEEGVEGRCVSCRTYLCKPCHHHHARAIKTACHDVWPLSTLSSLSMEELACLGDLMKW